MAEIRCFVFRHIAHAHPTWTLAVMAVSPSDARRYVRAWHGGGKLVQELPPGSTVDAHCGGTTEAAQGILRERNRREQERYDAAWERCKRDNPEATEARLYQLVGAYL